MNPGSIVLVDVAEEGSEEPFTFTAMPKGELPDAPPIETVDQE
jgi:ATP-dependent Clp protease ATP-binding subunit ClpC